MSISTKNTNFTQILQTSSLSRPETEILLAFLLKRNREFILTHPETAISATLYKKFRTLEAKRLKNWPIAYLTGHKEFYGLDFKVSPSVLVPRPETEMMVDEMIDIVKKCLTDQYQPLIIDIGTGSGAIIVSVASEIRRLFPAFFKKIGFSAVDISASALNITQQNAKKHKLNHKIKFYYGNLLLPLKLNQQKLIGRKLIIAANLPYLTKAQIAKSSSIQREPKLALDGGLGGLKYYQELFKQLAEINLSGIIGYILCEINADQKLGIKKLCKRYFPQATLGINCDLSGQDRLVKITLDNN
jgi:release factor glutamine methyltransferase